MSDISVPADVPSGIGSGRLLVFSKLESTNSWAMDHLACLRHGDAVRAVRQTAGRGRLKRTWDSPGGGGLTVSLVLRRPADAVLAAAAGQAAAVAAGDFLRGSGLFPFYKWPNDVFVGGKKICGILSESKTSTDKMVVGVGLNCNQNTADFERCGLGGTATSLLLETGVRQDPEDVCARLIPFLGRAFDELLQRGSGPVFKKWAEADWLRGSRVEIETGPGSLRGAYAGIDRQGRLLLLLGSGETLQFYSGDVKKVWNDNGPLPPAG